MDPLRGHPASRLPAAADVAGLPPSSPAISRRADIGHVNLRVRDLERAVRFYRDVIGLELMVDRPPAEWPRGVGGEIAMRVDPLDLQALVEDRLRESGSHPAAER